MVRRVSSLVIRGGNSWYDFHASLARHVNDVPMCGESVHLITGLSLSEMSCAAGADVTERASELRTRDSDFLS